jgi:hypothetical protein
LVRRIFDISLHIQCSSTEIEWLATKTGDHVTAEVGVTWERIEGKTNTPLRPMMEDESTAEA